MRVEKFHKLSPEDTGKQQGSRETEQPSRNLLIFGQGPIIDTATKAKPNPGTAQDRVDVHMWRQSLAEAATVVLEKDQPAGKIKLEQYTLWVEELVGQNLRVKQP